MMRGYASRSQKKELGNIKYAKPCAEAVVYSRNLLTVTDHGCSLAGLRSHTPSKYMHPRSLDGSTMSATYELEEVP